MTWISSPPKSVHTMEDELPRHHNESGLVWESRDRTLWETTYETHWTNKESQRVVAWVRCNPTRAEVLRQKFAESAGQDATKLIQ